MGKLVKFGQFLLLINIVYCVAMMLFDAYQNDTYVFTSSYFFAAAFLAVFLVKLDKANSSVT
jgi:hypothetical protein